VIVACGVAPGKLGVSDSFNLKNEVTWCAALADYASSRFYIQLEDGYPE